MLQYRNTGAVAPFIHRVPVTDSPDGTPVLKDAWRRKMCISSTSNDMSVHLIANNARNYVKQ